MTVIVSVFTKLVLGVKVRESCERELTLLTEGVREGLVIKPAVRPETEVVHCDIVFPPVFAITKKLP